MSTFEKIDLLEEINDYLTMDRQMRDMEKQHSECRDRIIEIAADLEQFSILTVDVNAMKEFMAK